MATKIVTKNSSTASAVPTTGDLVQGELAVNVADKRLFTEDNAGAIVELGTNPSGNVTFQDNGKAIFGAGSDLQIYHDGSGSYIDDVGTGNLFVRADSLQLRRADGSQLYLAANTGAEVALYHAGNAKLATTATGIDVTGTATMDGGSISGNLLVGASSASAKLTVGTFGDTARAAQFHGGSILIDGGAASEILIGDGNVAYMSIQTTDNATAMKIRNHSGSADLVTIERASGNVGIGTSSPSRKVHIDGGSTDAAIQFTNTNTGSTGNDGTYIGHAGTGTDFQLFNYETGYMRFGTAGSERMRIDSAGHFIVGATSAFTSSSFCVDQSGLGQFRRDGTPLIIRRDGSDGGLIDFEKDGASVGSIGTNAATMYVSAPQAGGMKYSYLTSTNAVMLPVTTSGANADGLHDLGMSNARFKDLYLSGSVQMGGNLDVVGQVSSYDNVGASYGTMNFRATDFVYKNAGGSERMRIDSSGNLMVGTTSVNGVNGTTISNNANITLNTSTTSGGEYITFRINGTQVGSITTSGGNATDYNTSSDQRLKENIADADDAGSKIDAIQVRKFDWKVDGSHQDYGMIAQELQTVAPEAVSGDADSEEMMGVDYSKLVPMLIKEIQSLRNRVAQLEE